MTFDVIGSDTEGQLALGMHRTEVKENQNSRTECSKRDDRVSYKNTNKCGKPGKNSESSRKKSKRRGISGFAGFIMPNYIKVGGVAQW